MKQGNEEYSKDDFKNATDFYTEGIKVNCKDEELKAKLYSNRGTVQFLRGEYFNLLTFLIHVAVLLLFLHARHLLTHWQVYCFFRWFVLLVYFGKTVYAVKFWIVVLIFYLSETFQPLSLNKYQKLKTESLNRKLHELPLDNSVSLFLA